MKKYFAYIRVSTARQGQLGSSLQEQRAAIEVFAKRRSLTISAWFEDRETAAKTGRTQFVRMMSSVEKSKADGVILHKIDRGARNLWDWARIQNLLDAGREVHFVHDNLDMSSRGGRLAADIQAVVAADYVRNLRDEVRKGLRGRLNQGLYPFAAPVGYLNQGAGQVKLVDPVLGPLVREAFELYASGEYSFQTLQTEMARRGFNQRNGRPLNRSRLNKILRNPFYAGIIYLRAYRESFTGVHEPLVAVETFNRVQHVLDGKLAPRTRRNDFLYRQMIKCGLCGLSLIGEFQKGRVYYRCHRRSCPTTGIREDRLTRKIENVVSALRFTEAQKEAIRPEFERNLKHRTRNGEEYRRALALAVSAIESRLERLTDAVVDGVLTPEAYKERQLKLLLELSEAKEKLTRAARAEAQNRDQFQQFFDFLRRFETQNLRQNPTRWRKIVSDVASNLSVIGTEPYLTTISPWTELLSELSVPCGGPSRNDSRNIDTECTLERAAPPLPFDAKRVADILLKHLEHWTPPEIEPEERPRPSSWFKPRDDRGYSEAA